MKLCHHGNYSISITKHVPDSCKSLSTRRKHAKNAMAFTVAPATEASCSRRVTCRLQVLHFFGVRGVRVCTVGDGFVRNQISIGPIVGFGSLH